MALFIKSGDQLKAVQEKSFNLEKDIQKLTEENLGVLFSLKFVSGYSNSEFSIKAQEQDFFIDTLALNEQQNAIVIIEYKKDRSFSVIDQGFSYLSAMLHSKADLVLEVNKRLGKNFNKDDIDWDQSRLIFISPEFTNYQKNAINFKDLPFLLYEVKVYDNGIVQYEQIKPFRTSVSIQKYTKDRVVRDVTNQVKVFNVEDHFKDQKQKMRPLYIYLRDKIFTLDPRFKENPRAPYIGFMLGEQFGTKTVIYVLIRTNKLRLHIPKIRPEDVNDPQRKLRYRQGSFESKNTPESELYVNTEQDADYAMFITKQLLDRFYR